MNSGCDSKILFHGDAERRFASLPQDQQKVIAIIYPLLGDVARKGKAQRIDEGRFPVMLRIPFRGMEIDFFTTGERVLIYDFRSI